MGFVTGADVLLGVGEEVVRAGAGEVGPADLGGCEGEVGCFGRGSATHEVVAHELLEQLALFGCHGGWWTKSWTAVMVVGLSVVDAVS